MKYLIALFALVACLGCGTGDKSPVTGDLVWGHCRFCKKPGYSTANWIDPLAMQQLADKGDKEITSTIVCGDCRKKAGGTK